MFHKLYENNFIQCKFYLLLIRLDQNILFNLTYSIFKKCCDLDLLAKTYFLNLSKRNLQQ